MKLRLPVGWVCAATQRGDAPLRPLVACSSCGVAIEPGQFRQRLGGAVYCVVCSDDIEAARSGGVS